MRSSSPIFIIAFLVSLAGCADFPELEVSEAQFDSDTPYPDLVPLDELLEEPEPAITDELQETLTTRRDDLLATPDGATNDPLQARLDALRKKRDEKLEADPVIDDELRKRLEEGITAPTEPE
jgi:hypothetical protein